MSKIRENLPPVCGGGQNREATKPVLSEIINPKREDQFIADAQPQAPSNNLRVVSSFFQELENITPYSITEISDDPVFDLKRGEILNRNDIDKLIAYLAAR